MVLDGCGTIFVLVLMLYNLCLLVGSGGVTMPDVIGIYFSFNSGDLASTSSQMCGRWNLPMFLLRDGSLILMVSDSEVFQRRKHYQGSTGTP